MRWEITEQFKENRSVRGLRDVCAMCVMGDVSNLHGGKLETRPENRKKKGRVPEHVNDIHGKIWKLNSRQWKQCTENFPGI